MSAPGVRASYLRLLLSRCDEFGPPAAEIRERLGDEHLTHIECAGPMVWLPVETDIALQVALDEVLGGTRAREFALASLREVWAGSLLQPLLITAVGLFGLHPGSFAKLMPAAWGLLYRECGRWEVGETMRVAGDAAGRRGVELHLRELPADCVAAQPWLGAVETVLHALLILCDVEGEVELREREPLSGTASFYLSWVLS
ncbi:hypothetical protein G6O69_03685 [Pseudenhygromyxa sp. WMMC2535]|uniref:hypothetical protein n=1 Tax=Pseudenhygromyxa sp. WMMC2535 TaxID=2712867 RepID=UPI001556FBC3|nr:hypothetical protein [Pseudenhygromyxa sp. WMMC2535]NVB36917.1 hypothetical protein [Pseudenhygromyxa sp. WMMC2535]